MSCTILYLTNDGEPGIPKKVGTIPPRPVQWEVSAWLIDALGQRHTHSITIPSCMASDLIPAIGQRLRELSTEVGGACRQFGWSASAHGSRKKRHRR